MGPYTGTITEAITLVTADNIYGISVKAVGGTVTITGANSFRGNSSTAVTLAENESYQYTVPLNNPINGVTITPGTGTAEVSFDTF